MREGFNLSGKTDHDRTIGPIVLIVVDDVAGALRPALGVGA
jgi:hypothetical protein